MLAEREHFMKKMAKKGWEVLFPSFFGIGKENASVVSCGHGNGREGNTDFQRFHFKVAFLFGAFRYGFSAAKMGNLKCQTTNLSS